MAYQFHYTPTGTGVISGKEVLEQTEDAINDLSGQISGDVQTAIDTANNALNTANTASADAQNAINTANTAYTAATNAQNTANTAQNTASNALTAAQNAQNDVNALGNRVTTAEGNITQNTNAITGLTTRMGTAEGNIGNLQTAVSTAQATANSAQQTATTARQQSYVFRYSSTALTASSTNSNTLLDNTDNLKVGDKVIDSSGVLFSITAIDTQNSTFTIGTALIDLAQDSDVVHTSGNETINGELTASKFISNYIQSNTGDIQIQSAGSNRSCSMFNGASAGDGGGFWAYGKDSANGSDCRMQIYNTTKSRYERTDLVGSQFLPNPSGELDCGSTSNKWKTFNGLNPGSLSFPDFSNGIDISGYITLGTTAQTYTAPADGWILIQCRSSVASGCYIENSSGYGMLCPHLVDYGSNDRLSKLCCPVKKNEVYTIVLKSIDISVTAYFYPCLGNV